MDIPLETTDENIQKEEHRTARRINIEFVL